MAQFGRPSTDTTREDWTDNAGGTTNIYQAIDETSPDDNDFIRSAEAPTADAYVTKLTAMEDPQSSSGHVIRYRYGKSASGGAAIDLTVQLREGYTNESSMGTLIKAWTHTNISSTLTTAQQTLTSGEADSISDYSSLYLRFVANQP